MEAIKYKGHEVRLARQTGGKAGKGCNKTTTLQVFKGGDNIILKAIRVKLDDPEGHKKAARKAREFIDGQAV